MAQALLIVPSPGGFVVKGTGKFHRHFPPHSLLIIASLLRNHGWDVEINDLHANRSLSPEQVINKAKAANLVIVTTSPYVDWQCPSYAIQSMLEFIRRLPSEHLIVTGNHGSHYPGGLLKETGARVIVRDEPEWIVLEIAQTLQNEGAGPNGSQTDLSSIEGISYRDEQHIRHNPQRKLSPLDTFPPPAYDLINLRDYYYELLGHNFAMLETSRGCPYSCRFCNRSMFQNQYRKRDCVAPVLHELKTLIEEHGCRSLYIFDLEFTLHREMVKAVCQFLIEKGYAKRLGFRWACQTRLDSIDEDLLTLMKQSGCALMHFGIEAGNADILASTRKKLDKEAIRQGIAAVKRVGIQSAGFFMFGLPGENLEHYRETLHFALELNPTFASFHPLLPFPGSPLFEERYGKSPYWNEPLRFDMSYFSPEEEKILSRFVRKAYVGYYLRPQYILNLLAQGNWDNYMRQFKLFLGFALQK